MLQSPLGTGFYYYMIRANNRGRIANELPGACREREGFWREADGAENPCLRC
ncbi:hypothetical protein [[Clostridium] scindens]|uniref:hypothetical protein n=1 Tax=Clostridium scindens (strain JCM 10418 / VPI 12708) TaxID=29347 RepID=UPI001C70A730|nr:hypothetical protein [[Clostridium] scindens]QYX28738.1 hypothetical protein K0036_09220 [[Clostridium] scindens]